ncbi:16S rRNA (uracil(1498)-N(3))-methyltransferase [Mycolicibacterium sp.]|jgi:16S rRNA (uracil1498-N3)-methyltransferase|uniref:16S rRNA (uracil(1498)-N(3))-methyltransferase n=1 Tax=Mycolicibacterium sp. TaxID=2320850 RepID=UPI0028A7D233|nr:16S rRNA (uracil(1498)-N(3))-methyltransferase [Mycolicibacterium sp.]
MAATLFYADVVPAVGDTAVVDGDEGFHAATVRRIRPGELLVISDGAGALADCVVEHADKRSLTVRVTARRTVPQPRPPVTVVQAIPKSERSELAVELATEAGADEIIAWQAERCVARWEGDRAAKGLRRWRAVARSAARQSRRPWIPDVDGPLSTRELCGYLAERRTAVALVLHESAERRVSGIPVAEAEGIIVVVGPEGGISDSELDALTAAGAVTTVLGPTVLRTSTAAAVALGALGVLTPRWAG